MKRHPIPETAPPLPSQPLPDTSLDTATLELLARWKRQDATDNPDEIRAAEQELMEFKEALNESRVLAGESPLY